MALIFICEVNQMYAIDVKPKVANKHGVLVDYTFQTKYGALPVMNLVGKPFGSKVELSRGYAHILYPTPELWTITLPHRTQILYTADISLILTELDIGPNSVVCEAGTGSGSLSHAFLRLIGEEGHLYTCDFHQNRVDVVSEEFERHGFGHRVTVSKRDVCTEGWGVTGDADAVFLDLPMPWNAIKFAIKALKAQGGRICSFSPCLEQTSKVNESMRSYGLTDISTVECLQREFQSKPISLPIINIAKVPFSPGENEIKGEIGGISKKLKTEEGANISAVSLFESNTGTLESEPVEPHSQVTRSDKHLTNSSKNGKHNKNSTVNASSEVECQKAKEIRFQMAVPTLKMPGHTGYLTFATVSPNLSLT